MKDKFVDLYMDVAQRVAHLSHGVRLKVGAVIVKDHRILSYGYNGTPSGFDNCCEYKTYLTPDISDISDGDAILQYPFEDDIGRHFLTSNPEVIHAETNAIAKVAKGGDSSDQASIFITHSPCIECSKLILQSGISSVYYGIDYRKDDGIKLLRKGNIEVNKL